LQSHLVAAFAHVLAGWAQWAGSPRRRAGRPDFTGLMPAEDRSRSSVWALDVAKCSTPNVRQEEKLDGRNQGRRWPPPPNVQQGCSATHNSASIPFKDRCDQAFVLGFFVGEGTIAGKFG